MYFLKSDLLVLCVLNIEVWNYRNNMLTILIDLIKKGDIASQNMMRAVARQVCEQLISGKISFIFNVWMVFKFIAEECRVWVRKFLRYILLFHFDALLFLYILSFVSGEMKLVIY